MNWIIKLIVAGVILVSVCVLGGSLVSSYNTQAGLKNLYEMKLKDNTSEFDNMWKTIAQVVQIPEAKKAAFVEIFSKYAEARTSDSQGQMMAWIKEAVPNVDLSTYDHAMNIIVGKRDGWTMRQKELVAVVTPYNFNLTQFPKNIWLGFFFKKIDPQLVTSSRTENAFKTGKDDDVNLGLKK